MIECDFLSGLKATCGFIIRIVTASPGSIKRGWSKIKIAKPIAQGSRHIKRTSKMDQQQLRNGVHITKRTD